MSGFESALTAVAADAAARALDWSVKKVSKRFSGSKRPRTETMDGISGAERFDQDSGVRYRRTGTLVRGRKRFSVAKLLRSTICHTEQRLGVRDPLAVSTFEADALVSEFDPTTGGYIALDNNMTQRFSMPMHCYDLNYFIGDAADRPDTSWPTLATTQNSNINSRMWYWKYENKWDGLGLAGVNNKVPYVRYNIVEPKTDNQNQNPSQHVYRKGIKIDYMLYGCGAMATEFDIRVIRITDPKMCPDYAMSLTGDELAEFQENWSQQIYHYVSNPMLKGFLRPKPVKPWFKTIAKKRVTIGEQTSLESLPAYQGRIYVKLNEVNNYSWTMTNQEVNVDTAPEYDQVTATNPGTEGIESAFKHKPYYTSRYYLLIRALVPKNSATGGNTADTNATESVAAWFDKEGIPAAQLKYTPSYDLNVTTTFMTINANS